MAKITSKASLVLGTNLKLHVADKGGTDIAITKAGSVLTITSSTTDFTASSEAGGIVNRALAVDDVITISHTGNAANEGITAKITAAGANSLTADLLTGTGASETAGADINIIAFKKTIQYLEAGGLSFVDGVQTIVTISKLVDLWDTSDLDRYLKVVTSIEPRAKSIAMVNGWDWHDLSTIFANRDSACEIRPSKTAAATKIYALLRNSGANCHAPTDQITYWYDGDAELDAPNNFVMTGYANQLVLIYDDNDGTPIDQRGTWYTRLAEPGKTVIMEQHNLQFAEIYPISAANGIDPKLGNDSGPFVSDGTIAAGGIYANIDFNLDVDSVYAGLVNSISYDFYGFVEGDSQLNETVHAKINYLWRQATNVNSDGTGPTLRGDKQWPLTSFSGDAFTVKSYLNNYAASQRNNLTLIDDGGVPRAWPAIYTVTRTAPALAVGGTGSFIHANTFGTDAPVYAKNESGTDLKDIAITASDSFIFAYSTYNVDGHTPNTPLDLVYTWNRPGYIEPDSEEFTLGPANTTVAVTPVADPSYTAA